MKKDSKEKMFNQQTKKSLQVLFHHPLPHLHLMNSPSQSLSTNPTATSPHLLLPLSTSIYHPPMTSSFMGISSLSTSYPTLQSLRAPLPRSMISISQFPTSSMMKIFRRRTARMTTMEAISTVSMLVRQRREASTSLSPWLGLQSGAKRLKSARNGRRRRR